MVTSTAGRVYFDGFKCAGKLIEHTRDLPGKEAQLRSVQTSATTQSRPTFAQIELTGTPSLHSLSPKLTRTSATDDDSLLDGVRTESLGEIKLEIFRVACLRTSGSMSRGVSVPAAYKVHERAKKMGGHCVRRVPYPCTQAEADS